MKLMLGRRRSWGRGQIWDEAEDEKKESDRKKAGVHNDAVLGRR